MLAVIALLGLKPDESRQQRALMGSTVDRTAGDV